MSKMRQNEQHTKEPRAETRGLLVDFAFAWSCNCEGPDWEPPDTITITAPAADALKNTSAGFASGQPSLSNTGAADPGQILVGEDEVGEP